MKDFENVNLIAGSAEPTINIDLIGTDSRGLTHYCLKYSVQLPLWPVWPEELFADEVLNFNIQGGIFVPDLQPNGSASLTERHYIANCMLRTALCIRPSLHLVHGIAMYLIEQNGGDLQSVMLYSQNHHAFGMDIYLPEGLSFNCFQGQRFAHDVLQMTAECVRENHEEQKRRYAHPNLNNLRHFCRPDKRTGDLN